MEESMRECLVMISRGDKELSHSIYFIYIYIYISYWVVPMERNTRENLRIINATAKENLLILIIIFLMDNGIMMSSRKLRIYIIYNSYYSTDKAFKGAKVKDSKKGYS